MILGRILASKRPTDEDDDEDDHEVGSSFIQKGTMLRSKNDDFEVQKWIDFDIQKWFKNEWIWDPKMVQKWMDFGRC